MRVDRDRIALDDQRDVAARVSLGRDVADDHAPGAARKAPVGDQADRFAQPLADQRPGRREHFRHAGRAFRAEVAQHHHVARNYLLGHDRSERRLLVVEHARYVAGVLATGNCAVLVMGCDSKQKSARQAAATSLSRP